MAGFFDTLFGGGAQEDAAAKNAAALGTYQTGANQALQTGYDTGVGNLNSAIGAYSPPASTRPVSTGQAGNLLLGNALGDQWPSGQPQACAGLRSPMRRAIAAPSMPACRRIGLNQRVIDGHGQLAAMPTSTRRRSWQKVLQNQQYNTWPQNLVGAVGIRA